MIEINNSILKGYSWVGSIDCCYEIVCVVKLFDVYIIIGSDVYFCLDIGGLLLVS